MDAFRTHVWPWVTFCLRWTLLPFQYCLSIVCGFLYFLLVTGHRISNRVSLLFAEATALSLSSISNIVCFNCNGNFLSPCASTGGAFNPVICLAIFGAIFPFGCIILYRFAKYGVLGKRICLILSQAVPLIVCILLQCVEGCSDAVCAWGAILALCLTFYAAIPFLHENLSTVLYNQAIPAIALLLNCLNFCLTHYYLI